MMSQTIFDRSELIIIDADSPDGEERIISHYMKRHPNIVYKRMIIELAFMMHGISGSGWRAGNI